MKEEKKIGDKVWWATYENKPIIITCPICFGQKEVTLILGNGEHIKTDCNYCVSGFEPPKGYTTEYQLISGVREIQITGKEVQENEQGRRVEYRFENYCLDDSNTFETKEEAENRVGELIKEYEDNELKRNEHKKRSNQTKLSWSVGYYKRQLKDAQKNIDFYSRKIIELK
jgi:hypothetical protein